MFSLNQGVSNLKIHYSLFDITSAWQIPADGLSWHYRHFWKCKNKISAYFYKTHRLPKVRSGPMTSNPDFKPNLKQQPQNQTSLESESLLWAFILPLSPSLVARKNQNKNIQFLTRPPVVLPGFLSGLMG